MADRVYDQKNRTNKYYRVSINKRNGQRQKQSCFKNISKFSNVPDIQQLLNVIHSK